MKRFITTTLGLSMVFVGIGAIVERTTASYKSDEKALEIIKKARTAIGGDAAIASVRSLVIKGQTMNTLTIDGTDRIEQGETELALQFPDKLIRKVKIGKGDGAGAEGEAVKTFDVIINNNEAAPENGEKKKFVIRKMDDGEAKEMEAGEAKVFVRKIDGETGEFVTDENTSEVKTADGKKFTIVRKAGDGELKTEGGNVLVERRKAGEHGPRRSNELLRTTLALLVTAPEGMDVSYSYAGESSLDGTPVNAVVASFGGASYKLFFDSSSYLPVAMSYVGHPGPIMVKLRKEGGDTAAKSDVVTFSRKAAGPAEGVETLVRFSDFRSTDGVQLPYKWTTSTGSKVTEIFDITSYEVNSANISERFDGQKIRLRSKVKAQN